MAWFFIIYLVIGAMFAFALVLRRPNAENTLSNYATSDRAAGPTTDAHRRSWLHTLASATGRIETLFRAISYTAVWPTQILMFVFNYKSLKHFKKKEIGSKRYLATASELAPAYAESVFALSVVILTYAAMSVSDSTSQYAEFVLLLMICHVLFRHASYNLSLILLKNLGYPEFLPSFFAEIRQHYAHPYMVFLAIILLDLGTYLIAFDGVIHSTKLLPIDLGRIATLYQEILNYEKFDASTGTGALSPEQYLLPISGFVFSLSLLSSLTNYSQFKRTTEDHLAIAARKNVIGDHGSAILSLKQIHAHQRTRHFFEAEVATHFGMGNPSKAIRAIKTLLMLEQRDPVPGLLFPSLFDVARMSDLPVSTYFPVLEAAVREGDVPDYALFFCVETYVAAIGLDQKEFQALYNKLRQFAKPKKYPLSFAFLRMISGKSKNESHIASSPKTATAYELYLHYRLLLWAKDGLKVNQQVMEEWFKKYAPKIFKSVEHMEFDYQKAGAILQTNMIGLGLAANTPGGMRDLADLVDKAIESIEDDATRSFVIDRLKQASGIKHI